MQIKYRIVLSLSQQDMPAFKEMMRMSPDQLKKILKTIEPDICKQSNKTHGELIVPAETVALMQLRLSRPAISYKVTEECEAITKQFEEKWNFLGAIDEKHIPLQTPDPIIITICRRLMSQVDLSKRALETMTQLLSWEIPKSLSIKLISYKFLISNEFFSPATAFESLTHMPLKQESNKKSKVRIGHQNVRSLKNRDHLVQLRSLAQENDLDILAVSESWLNS